MSSAEYRSMHKAEIAAYNVAYYAEHAVQLSIKHAQWEADNRDKKKEYASKYYNNNLVKELKRSAIYRINHQGKVRAAAAKWAAEHLLERRIILQLRRARIRNAPGANYTTRDHIEARWEYYGRRCYLCGDMATATDHVKPVAKGGAEWPCNLRPICGLCNSKKGHKWPYKVSRIVLGAHQ